MVGGPCDRPRALMAHRVQNGLGQAWPRPPMPLHVTHAHRGRRSRRVCAGWDGAADRGYEGRRTCPPHAGMRDGPIPHRKSKSCPPVARTMDRRMLRSATPCTVTPARRGGCASSYRAGARMRSRFAAICLLRLQPPRFGPSLGRLPHRGNCQLLQILSKPCPCKTRSAPPVSA